MAAWYSSGMLDGASHCGLSSRASPCVVLILRGNTASREEVISPASGEDHVLPHRGMMRSLGWIDRPQPDLVVWAVCFML